MLKAVLLVHSESGALVYEKSFNGIYRHLELAAGFLVANKTGFSEILKEPKVEKFGIQINENFIGTFPIDDMGLELVFIAEPKDFYYIEARLASFIETILYYQEKLVPFNGRLCKMEFFEKEVIHLYKELQEVQFIWAKPRAVRKLIKKFPELCDIELKETF